MSQQQLTHSQRPLTLSCTGLVAEFEVVEAASEAEKSITCVEMLLILAALAGAELR